MTSYGRIGYMGTGNPREQAKNCLCMCISCIYIYTDTHTHRHVHTDTYISQRHNCKLFKGYSNSWHAPLVWDPAGC